MAIELVDEAGAAGAGQPEACEVLGITCRTLRRWRGAATLRDRRKGAARHCPQALSEAEKDAIVEICNQPENQSLPPSQIVPRLADKCIYIASESTVYRVLRQRSQINRRGRAHAPRRVSRPRPVSASTRNRVWSWDITYLPSSIKGQFFRLYMVLDIYSRKIVGWEVHHDELASHAAQLVRRTCARECVMPDQLVLHADNGGPMKGATMLAMLQSLGVAASFSRPSVSDDNPYSEALFRTLKYTPAYPAKPFQDIAAARTWVQRFVGWYNTEHRHSGIRFVTPEQRHAGRDAAVLGRRHEVYQRAKALTAERWRGRSTRNWSVVGEVWLNPEKAEEPAVSNLPLAA